jgi:mannose-1-phosphate guanylyltransferase / mannose-6-phosphate isomerase
VKIEAMKSIHPVLMCGGTGTRLWPVSRASLPKQYHTFVGDETLLQATAARVIAPDFAPPMLICNEAHRFIVAEQFAGRGLTFGRIVLEPVSRNTGPVAVAASLLVSQEEPDGLVLLLPADHLIKDDAAFRDMIRTAVPAAKAGNLCLFGIEPGRAETGYGYIEASDEPVPAPDSDVRRVRRFVEKPDLASAERMLAEGGYTWNSGIFLFSAASFLAEARRLQPALVEAVSEAVDTATIDLDFTRLGRAGFERAPSVSIDYSIMEHTTQAAVLPVNLDWSDLGAWDAIHTAHSGDADGNVILGRAISVATRDSFIRSDNQLVATVGVEGLIIVATDDAILVADKRRAQDVKHVLERLRVGGYGEAENHATVHRPWGAYRSVTAGQRFQVKLITVKPGGRLSLQLHHHRAEHWVVVRGTAQITCGDRVFTLYENQSTYIPQGEVHRLENPGRIPLEMIEVQSGSYLGEDDIIRVEDQYGRVQHM